MRRTEVPGVACSAASGSQVCRGTSGALIAKAIMKDAKIQRAAAGGALRDPAREPMR